MPKQGAIFENPVSKEKVIFLETSASTNGALLRMEAFGLANGFNRIDHIHPSQQERHEVLAGQMGVTIAGKEYILNPHESITFEKNVPHKFWNVSGADLHFITEFRPAYDTEGFIETYFAAARTGKVNQKGQPPLLHFFVMLQRYPIAGYAADFPIFLQKALISVLACIGKIFGYKGSLTYPIAERAKSRVFESV
ncbi:cupin domain-containing protein [candidate division KSB1 bacterium]|nr:cupin domain-containing protein [candidate division KSB1 bacterium]